MTTDDPAGGNEDAGPTILVTAGIGLVGGFGLGILQPLFVVGIGVGLYGGPSWLGLLFLLCVLVALVSGLLVMFAGGRDITLPVLALSGCLAVGMLAGNVFAGNARIGFATPRPPPAVHPTGPGWTTTGKLLTGRAGHTATLLGDGRVLVAGGSDGRHSLSSAEVYDPLAGTWTSTGSMVEPLQDHSAVLLRDGRVLAIGNSGAAELYDPAAAAWTATGSMREGRFDHAVTLLDDGRVLVSGGRNRDNEFAPAELYDPSSGTWRATRPMQVERSQHTATLLGDGRVLVAGGVTRGSDQGTTSAELLDPETGTWSAARDMAVKRWGHVAALRRDGSVLVAGGDMFEGTTEGFNPVDGTWAPGRAIEALLAPEAIPLGDDRILLIEALGAVTVIDPADPVSRTRGSSGHGSSSTATLLQDGRVLVAGGSVYGRSDRLNDAHLYDPG